MRVSVELRQAVQDRIEERGSLRKAAKGRDVKWYDLSDILNRPHLMSAERIMRVYEAFDMQPPTRKRYWRPCVDPDVGEVVREFLAENPELDINDLFQIALAKSIAIDFG